jgi:hypothetical protein
MTPGSEQVPGSAEIGPMELIECLLMDGIVIFAYAAPFLEKWTQCLQHVHPIFDIHLPLGCSCSILQGVGSRLHLLKAIPAEQGGQVGG